MEKYYPPAPEAKLIAAQNLAPIFGALIKAGMVSLEDLETKYTLRGVLVLYEQLCEKTENQRRLHEAMMAKQKAKQRR